MVKFQNLMVPYDTILKCIVLFGNEMANEERKGCRASKINYERSWMVIHWAD